MAAALTLMIIPGPDMAYCIASGVASGRRGALCAALGIGFGGLILTVMTALVIYSARQIDPIYVVIIQAIGCMYLVYIAITSLYRRPNHAETQLTNERSSRAIFVTGFITNVSNPKAIIFFISFIPQFIPTDQGNPAMYAGFLGLIVCIVGTILNIFYGLIGGTVFPRSSILFLGRTIPQYILSATLLLVSTVFFYNIIY